MKIRKGLLAAATAATVSISGMTAPAFAASSDKPATAVEATDDTTTEGNEEGSSFKKFGEDLKAGSSDKDGNWDPKKISAWIGVFTALLTAVGALIKFLDKNFDIKF
ncbi:hypothetical protein KBX19_04010 [Corynebacterium sp. CCUG 71335]|uniref:hypothetical protein n=1 Tax=unclassified Corynebacterium TaxID=2624378 RepID=UPI00210960B2|nr:MULTISPECIES: hypothetical protein [unclassified Corynebacterium]MCQ4618703.1 hypothetical protein [Corynebacterium pseudogenitalium]MCQ4620378.1 hypothetical protein [Corynebacterium sp. CCUG 71335]MCQ4627042.1 hypothetical protein [Corynebacterium sp. CCUG 65737]